MPEVPQTPRLQLSSTEKGFMPFWKACLCPARAPPWFKHTLVWHDHYGYSQWVQGPLTEVDCARCSLLFQ